MRRLRSVAVAAITLGATACIPSLDGCPSLRAEQAGITMEAQPGSAGWHVSFLGIPGRPTNVVVRVGGGSETTYRMATFIMPADQGPTDIHLVEYTLDGVTHKGPLTFRFDPKSAQLKSAKDSLSLLRTQLVAWRRWVGKDTVNFIHVMSHSCALESIEYGFGDELDQTLAFECGWNATDDYDAAIVELEANKADHILVRVTFADGEVLPTQRIANPNFGSGAWTEGDAADGDSLQKTLKENEDETSREDALVSLLNACAKGGDLHECRRAAKRPGLDGHALTSPGEIESVRILNFCETKTHAWAELWAKTAGERLMTTLSRCFGALMTTGLSGGSSSPIEA